MAELFYHDGKMVCTFGRQPEGDWYYNQRHWTDHWRLPSKYGYISSLRNTQEDIAFTITAAHNVRFHYGPLHTIDYLLEEEIRPRAYQHINEKWWNRVNAIPLRIDSEIK